MQTVRTIGYSRKKIAFLSNSPWFVVIPVVLDTFVTYFTVTKAC